MWNKNIPRHNFGNVAPAAPPAAPVANFPRPMYVQPQQTAAATQGQGSFAMQQPVPAQMQPAAPAPMQAYPTQQQTPAPAANSQEYIDRKITSVNAKNKVIDFSDMLVKAYDKDYANIHGSGGKGHAPNSGICINACDYTNGTGDASINVKFIVDVRAIDWLLCAVDAAANGTLGIAEQLRAITAFATANGTLIGWLQAGHQPTFEELAGLQRLQQSGLELQDPEGRNEKPLWSYDVQKNNPYRTSWENGREFTPVSVLSVQYFPKRRYQWNIKITNFMAPISRQANGATTHNAKEAVGKKEVIFPISTQAFHEALSDVSHYIHLWEYRMYPVVNAKCNERERLAEAKRNSNRR